MSEKVKRGFILSNAADRKLWELRRMNRDLTYSEIVERGIDLLYSQQVGGERRVAPNDSGPGGPQGKDQGD